MIDNYKELDKDKKDLMLKNDRLTKNSLIVLLRQAYGDKQDKIFTYNDYEFYDFILFNVSDKNTLNKDGELTRQLKEAYTTLLNNNMINDIYLEYIKLANNEGKHLLYTLSRLLYLQDKYKDEEIGQEIDTKIKEWLELIKTFDEKKDAKQHKQDLLNTKDDKQERIKVVKEYTKKLSARVFYQIIPSLNYDIYNFKDKRPYTDLWDYDKITNEDFIEFLDNFINRQIDDSNTYNRYNTDFNKFINDIASKIDSANFYKDKAKEIEAIKEKYGVKDNKDDNINVPNDTQEAFIEELAQLYHTYLDIEGNAFKIQDNDDVKKWRDKADKFINHLETYEGVALFSGFTMDYTLKHLAYNDYQREAYLLDLEDDIKIIEPTTKRKQRETPVKQPKKLNARELKDKYKDITLLDDDTTLDYNRKWARIDTSKVNTNIMDLRENITKKLENNTDITIKSIKELEKKVKPSKEDLEKLKDLKETLKEQQEQREKIQDEINDLKDDITLLDKQISDTTEAQQIKTLARRRKQLEKELKEKQNIINNGGVTMQMDLFTGKYTYEKQNKRKKETYKLMINTDYDIQNFNSEGRNFLYYVPNIPNIINDLDEDFINIDIDDYLDFTGRPNGNVSRIRRNLQSTLKEMRKESYDYSFIDERGALQEGSLVLIGDIKGTEYKGKASVKVQLGATFKDNLKQVFIKNQYAKVNKDVFKLGQGKNNKAENMAKEIFIYLSRLCRIEAKKGTINGQWRKDIHLDLLITHLAEINLLNYNPNTYNKSVKEPLLNALNTGVELGLFSYKTNAFKYYDEVIATNNNGRNATDKIHNFENGDKYGVQFILNSDMVDLETNQKAHTTYKKYQSKAKNNPRAKQEATKK
ncbi:MAG: hypothetical protein IJ094_07865 [Bacilli bacterium]|nr:hypothetical protein [Bacilli bacterium]